ncbi:DUF3600 domain-containing protein [Paenibacillus sp. FSL W8-0426]|uniref:DUF3600 domain-containing protein n=1 Tax=Paenibacillus sp. FSL W8-0426 TaxID=2921714 RepID=UPI0030D9C7E3
MKELENELREAFKDQTGQWTVPTESKERLMQQIEKRVSSINKRRSSRWMVAGIISIALLIPTGAYAGYTYLADGIYGSQQSVAALGVTVEEYARLEAKLQGAKAHFSNEDYTAFMSLLQQWGKIALAQAGPDGQLHPEQWDNGVRQQYEALAVKLEPYFTQLEQVSSHDIRMSHNIIMGEEQFWKEQFAQAKEMFSAEDYADFQAVYEEMKRIEALTVTSDGTVNEEQLSEKQRSDLDELTQRISVYLKRLGLEIR